MWLVLLEELKYLRCVRRDTRWISELTRHSLERKSQLSDVKRIHVGQPSDRIGSELSCQSSREPLLVDDGKLRYAAALPLPNRHGRLGTVNDYVHAGADTQDGFAARQPVKAPPLSRMLRKKVGAVCWGKVAHPRRYCAR